MSSMKVAHFVPIGQQTWPPHAILVSDRSISKKFSPLKLLSHMNQNLVGSIYMYGRFCIKFPQSRMKGERHRLSPLSLQFNICTFDVTTKHCICYFYYMVYEEADIEKLFNPGSFSFQSMFFFVVIVCLSFIFSYLCLLVTLVSPVFQESTRSFMVIAPLFLFAIINCTTRIGMILLFTYWFNGKRVGYLPFTSHYTFKFSYLFTIKKKME